MVTKCNIGLMVLEFNLGDINERVKQKSKLYLITLIILSSVFVNVSCKKDNMSILNESLKGSWSIDTLIIDIPSNKSSGDLRGCLLLNIFDIKEENRIDLPISIPECNTFIRSYVEDGVITIMNSKTDSNMYIARIETKNTFFQGDYKFRYYLDHQNGLLKMELSRGGIRLISRKGLLDYDRDLEKLKILESISNGGVKSDGG